MKNKSSRDVSVGVIFLFIFDLQLLVVEDIEQRLKFILKIHLILVFIFLAVLIIIIIWILLIEPLRLLQLLVVNHLWYKVTPSDDFEHFATIWVRFDDPSSDVAPFHHLFLQPLATGPDLEEKRAPSDRDRVYAGLHNSYDRLALIFFFFLLVLLLDDWL